MEISLVVLIAVRLVLGEFLHTQRKRTYLILVRVFGEGSGVSRLVARVSIDLPEAVLLATSALQRGYPAGADARPRHALEARCMLVIYQAIHKAVLGGDDHQQLLTSIVRSG